MASEKLKKLKEDSQAKVGEQIVASLLKRSNFSIADFQNLFSGGGNYDQTGGDYNQTGGGDHDQGSPGNYTQTASMARFDSVQNPGLDIEKIQKIVEESIKKNQ